MKRHNFRNLKIWKDGVDLTMETFDMVRSFPDFEKFNLSSQLVRSAISIPSNIAEGTSKKSNKHFAQYIEHSLGSAFEWETQLIIARKQKYIDKEQYQLLIDKVEQLQKMISSFLTKIS